MENYQLMENYHNLIWDILEHGEDRPDRTGTGTKSLFGEHLEFDLTGGFPLLTTRKLFWRGILHELLWFLHPTQDTWYLRSHGVHIWDAWASPRGLVGPIYGNQWRHWRVPEREHERMWHGSVDQLSVVINQIKSDPYSRRHFISAWNVADLDLMALQPCHVSFQFYVHTDGRLDCHMYQRSADVMLGVPFNIASYALLTMMVAQVTGNHPGTLCISFGDAHIYQNHFSQARELIERKHFPAPELHLNPEIIDIDLFTPADIELRGYQAHPAITMPISV